MTVKVLQFTDDTKTLYPMLLIGFRNGSRALSSANPANNGREKRAGKPVEIMRSEARIETAILGLGHERDWTDDELAVIAAQHKAAERPLPTPEELAKQGKPLELKVCPSALVLSIADFERLKTYYEEASWDVVATREAARLWDAIDAAEKTERADS